MKYVLIFFLFFTGVSCITDNESITTTLEGKWVDIHTKTDTLTFGSSPDEFFLLSRGKEMKDGFLLPKSGSGLYDFTIVTDDNMISLRWLLSSNSNFENYYFKQTGNTLLVEQFYDTTAPGTLLTFKKVE